MKLLLPLKIMNILNFNVLPPSSLSPSESKYKIPRKRVIDSRNILIDDLYGVEFELRYLV